MRAALLAVVLMGSLSSAHAADEALERSVLEIAYVTPALAALLTTIVNGAFLAYDEGAPLGWRIAGYAVGGVELAIGTGVLIYTVQEDRDPLYGVVPLVLGTAAIVTAYFAPAEKTYAVTPLVSPGLVGISWSARF